MRAGPSLRIAAGATATGVAFRRSGIPPPTGLGCRIAAPFAYSVIHPDAVRARQFVTHVRRRWTSSHGWAK
jgi:hypothetical protein